MPEPFQLFQGTDALISPRLPKLSYRGEIELLYESQAPFSCELPELPQLETLPTAVKLLSRRYVL